MQMFTTSFHRSCCILCIVKVIIVTIVTVRTVHVSVDHASFIITADSVYGCNIYVGFESVWAVNLSALWAPYNQRSAFAANQTRYEPISVMRCCSFGFVTKFKATFLTCDIHLTFRGPRVVSIFVLIYFQRDSTLHSLFISGKLLYMFRVVFPPNIRSTNNCF